MSERITITVREEHLQILDVVEQQADIDSTAAAVRACITESARLQREVEALQHCRARDRDRLEAEYEDRIAELEQDLQTAEARQDELRRALVAANTRNDQTEALVEYVEKGPLGRLREWISRD